MGTQTVSTIDKSKIVSGALDIGKLYDVLGQMAKSESCNNAKGQVLTGLDALSKDTKQVGSNDYYYPEKCDLNTEQELSHSEFYYGKSYKEFQNSYSAQAGLSGNYGYFSATLDMKYSSTEQTTETLQYGTMTVFEQYGMLTIQDKNQELTREFSKVLNDPNVDAKTLFGEWGTHVIVGVLLGGQASYMCCASKSTYKSETEFELAVEANYKCISGYAGFTNSSSEYQEEVQGSTTLYVLGGDTALLNSTNEKRWDEWCASVKENPDWMDFTEKGLKPVWDFCDDPDRKAYLKDQFNYLYSPHCNDQQKEVHGYSDSPQVGCNTDNPDLFVTGFGGRINGNVHFTRCAVQYENVYTGERHWVVDGDQTTFIESNYELIGEIPAGCALTGIGLREKSTNLQNMVFYYQTINRGRSNNNDSALFPDVQTMYVGGQLDGYEVEYKPSNNNTRVIQGIYVSATGSKSRVNTLDLYTSVFAMPIEK